MHWRTLTRIIPLRFCQNFINTVQIHIGTNVTHCSTLIKELDNQCCKIYHVWELTAVFLDSQVFSFHRLAYEAGSGRGNCCPSDIEAGRHTTSRDPYPIAEFQSDSKKMALAEAQTSFCVHLSVCLCLSQALFSSAQMISISLSFFFFFSLPPLNANLRLVRASKSLFKRRLQWDWPAHHTWYRRCSVNHTSTIWK